MSQSLLCLALYYYLCLQFENFLLNLKTTDFLMQSQFIFIFIFLLLFFRGTNRTKLEYLTKV